MGARSPSGCSTAVLESGSNRRGRNVRSKEKTEFDREMGMGAEEGRGMLKLDASAVGTLVWLFIITHGSLVQALYTPNYLGVIRT